ncbi:hypothetical protein A3H89_03215 [Candidatus Amesbacteria bacterium RIFCSPLOWO2_02_FULL_48_11]|uniref:Transposase IS200-like domain-containing protein n=3 Tax=Candidatus Amesiibacteriota TaxID=1752730 RepID=A0A1F4ZD88_9BACT|nr:MAG: hypothetical protein A3E17_03355 [Candidatus Amesbacteria bacterium RIFCSPHIGHO2_12_FULL_48_14]OGD08700.1 MAG: hypothetical protein A3H89_03215 [Candidatus Amesbacteria bacterium RIFCSPLOWO2_02_FULL_48_11]
MPGREEPLVTGEYYHIYNRGITDLDTFQTQKDYLRFVEIFNYYKLIKPPIRFSYYLRLPDERKEQLLSNIVNSQRKVKVICYCLMPNHFHLLIKQIADFGVSNFLSQSTNSYTRYFNTKRFRKGPIFQGTFKSVGIESEEQLIHVSRYIHINPYSAGVVKTTKDLENYPFSSFSEFISDEVSPICDKQPVLSLFPSKEEYRKFVLNQADNQRQIEFIKHLVLDT